jgi:hypothetical protein
MEQQQDMTAISPKHNAHRSQRCTSSKKSGIHLGNSLLSDVPFGYGYRLSPLLRQKVLRKMYRIHTASRNLLDAHLLFLSILRSGISILPTMFLKRYSLKAYKEYERDLCIHLPLVDGIQGFYKRQRDKKIALPQLILESKVRAVLC